MMHCPRCNLEYQDGAAHCADCGVALVAGPPIEPAEASHPDITLERVFASGDAALIPLAKSLLDDAEIEYLAKGEGIQDLIGWGRLGTGLNYLVGPVEFYVASEDAASAREILRYLTEGGTEESPDEGPPA